MLATHNFLLVILPQPATELDDARIISCSILVKQGNRADIVQVIPRLVIDHSRVILRDDASSVQIASLILALRAGIEFQGFRIEEPLLSDLITGTIPYPDLVSVSTSRVPNFSSNAYRDADSGYQFIGLLSQVNTDVDNDLTQHTTAYTSGEVISAALTPESSQFFSTYRPMNVVPESNFVLIFSLHKESAIPSQCPESMNPDIHNTFVASEPAFNPLNAPLFDFVTANLCSFDGLAEPFYSPALPEELNWDHIFPTQPIYSMSAPQVLQERSHDLEIEGGLGDHSLDLHSRASAALPTPPRSSPYPTPSRSRCGSISTEQRILLFLAAVQPPVGNSPFHDAKFVVRNNTLTGMIRNHRSMTKLLDICGLDCSAPDRVRSFSGSDTQTHKLTVESVFIACGWSESTFGNKTSRYQNAEKAAKMHWNGAVPDIGLFLLYSYHST
jgi:hypothetical protein